MQMLNRRSASSVSSTPLSLVRGFTVFLACREAAGQGIYSIYTRGTVNLTAAATEKGSTWC